MISHPAYAHLRQRLRNFDLAGKAPYYLVTHRDEARSWKPEDLVHLPVEHRLGPDQHRIFVLPTHHNSNHGAPEEHPDFRFFIREVTREFQAAEPSRIKLTRSIIKPGFQTFHVYMTTGGTA